MSRLVVTGLDILTTWRYDGSDHCSLPENAAVLPPHRPTLKYLEVRDFLRMLVTKELRPGDAMPSERALCERFAVSRMTVRQAVDALVVEGWVERVQGSGTYVTRPKVDLQVRLTSFSEEMSRRGMTGSATVLAAETTGAAAEVAAALALPPHTAVLHLHRLQYADGEPMAVEHTWLPAARVPGFLDHGVPSSVYGELAVRGLMPDVGEDTIQAGEADPEEAQLLQIGPGKPVLRVTRRAFSADLPVEYTRSVFRADRYTLRVPIARPTQASRNAADLPLPMSWRPE